MINTSINVSDIAALKALPVGQLVTGANAQVVSYYDATPGDGGGGLFSYDSASSVADNGGTTIAPNAGSGRWLRRFSGAVNVKWFGAKGDNFADDATAIDAAVQTCYALGGGVVFIPEGTYVLGTVSSVSGNQYSYIVPKDGVSIVGSGIDVTVLKVKSGQNDFYYSVEAPNVISTQQATPLKNCRFSDFTVDWNGANNLLTVDMKARGNYSIFSANGGQGVIVERIRVKETPGNQCVYFKATSDLGQGDIMVRNCRFEDSGSGLSGNYNQDHSSVYLNGDRICIENCTFTASQRVNGTCFELHGSDANARGNVGNDYTLSSYFATNFKALKNACMSDCYFTNIKSAIGISAEEHAFDNMTVRGCTFEQSSSDTYTVGQSFALGYNPSVVCNRITIDDCRFVGNSTTNCRMMLINLIREVTVSKCLFKGFSDFGIWFGGNTVGGSRFIDALMIIDNDFDECAQPIYCNVGGSQQFGTVTIRGNSFLKAASSADRAILVAATAGGIGEVGPNNISPNYTGGVDGVSANIVGLDLGDHAMITTFMPEVSGGTMPGSSIHYTQQKCTLVRTNGQVRARMYLKWDSLTGATGNLQISLPSSGKFQPSTSPNATVEPVSVAYSEDISLDDTKQLGGLFVYGGPYIQLYEFSDTAPTILPISGNGTLVLSFDYEAQR